MTHWIGVSRATAVSGAVAIKSSIRHQAGEYFAIVQYIERDQHRRAAMHARWRFYHTQASRMRPHAIYLPLRGRPPRDERVGPLRLTDGCIPQLVLEVG